MCSKKHNETIETQTGSPLIRNLHTQLAFNANIVGGESRIAYLQGRSLTSVKMDEVGDLEGLIVGSIVGVAVRKVTHQTKTYSTNIDFNFVIWKLE